MKEFDPNTFTYGYELELADVHKLRMLDLPEELGKWEWCELDIANTLPPYEGIAVDPKGVDPPVGGEINTKPTRSWHAQLNKIMSILDWMRQRGETPNASFTSPGHIHVHVPFLTDDIRGLKNLIRYLRDNQRDVTEICYGYEKKLDMSAYAAQYMHFDGGRLMPDFVANNIIDLAQDFNDLLRIYGCGKDGITRSRPFRYAINPYCLKWTQTIEFRCFRATLSEEELASSFKAVEGFMDAALNDGPDFRSLMEEKGLIGRFAPMRWDARLWAIYEATRKPKGPISTKNREFYPVASL